MLNKLLLFFLVFLVYLPSRSQNIVGKITVNSGDPVSYVSIILSNDSLYNNIVKTANSNDSGLFKITNIKEGNYYIKATLVGFKPYSRTISVNATENKNIEIKLIDTSSELNNVVIKSKRPLLKKEVDKFIFNVSNSSLTAGGSAFDVLKHTPLVIARNDGSINIAGFSSGAVIYINNRKSFLTNEDLTNYLTNMPSDNIISIEIMTSPSAKYEAGASGGIINILLKKNYSEGFNGSFTLSDEQSKFNKRKSSILINYKRNRYSQQLQGSIDQGNDYAYLELKNIYPNVNQTENIFTRGYHKNKSAFATTSINYELSSKTNIGGTVDYNFNKNKEEVRTDDYVIYSNYIDSLFTHIFNNRVSNTASANLYYKFNEKANNRSLEFNIDGFTSNTNNTGNLISSLMNVPSDITNAFYNNGKQIGKNYSLKVDYAQYIFNNVSIELGGKYTYTETKNPYNFYNLDTTNHNYIYNPGVSNYFVYKENINAAYLNLQKQFSDKLSSKVGIRMEDTHIHNLQRTTSEIYSQSYTRWLPSGFISYDINKNNNISLTLRSDFSRPSFGDMNPFINYINNKTAVKGNPFLRPTKSIQAELSYILHNNYIFMARYSNENNLFQQVVTLYPPDTLMYLKTNYGFSKSFSIISVIDQTIIKDIWNMSLTNSLEWRTLNVIANGISSKNTYPIYTFYANQTFSNIGNSGIDANINAMYMNKWAQANVVMKSFGNLDFGFTKNLTKSDIHISLAVEDLLYTNTSRSSTIPNSKIINYLYARNNSRLVRITLVKKFGNKNMNKIKFNNSNNTQEKSRL